MSETFFELLQVAIGQRSELTSQPTAEEWAQLYEECERQSLIGIGFCGITRLPATQRPQKAQLVQWVQDAQDIKEKNGQLVEQCAAITQQLNHDGFPCCVLKGQSNRANYPANLADYRSPGDIDLWVWKPNGGIRNIVEYAQQYRKLHKQPIITWDRVIYHHVEIKNEQDTEIELHYRPSYMCSPRHNRKVQQWFKEQTSCTTREIGFPTPSLEFNAVFQLSHIYHHLFDEGVGLRQLLDYYFVLTKLPSEQKQNVLQTLNSFAMGRFAAAVMWVLQRVFAMPDVYLLCQPNAREGEFLLSEIMQAGNFGQYDQRIAHHVGQFRHAWEKSKHNLRLLRHYPREVLWEPCFRLYHWLWRRLELWK